MPGKEFHSTPKGTQHRFHATPVFFALPVRLRQSRREPQYSSVLQGIPLLAQLQELAFAAHLVILVRAREVEGGTRLQGMVECTWFPS